MERRRTEERAGLPISVRFANEKESRRQRDRQTLVKIRYSSPLRYADKIADCDGGCLRIIFISSGKRP
jgi:hypothetical protein